MTIVHAANDPANNPTSNSSLILLDVFVSPILWNRFIVLFIFPYTRDYKPSYVM